MTMDDDEPVIGLVEEEWFADPPKVGLPLLIELHAGPNAGMHEEIVAEPATVVEALEELDVLLGNGGADCLEGVFLAHAPNEVGINVVALQAF